MRLHSSATCRAQILYGSARAGSVSGFACEGLDRIRSGAGLKTPFAKSAHSEEGKQHWHWHSRLRVAQHPSAQIGITAHLGAFAGNPMLILLLALQKPRLRTPFGNEQQLMQALSKCIAEDAKGSCCLTGARPAKREGHRRVVIYHTWMHSAPDRAVSVVWASSTESRRVLQAMGSLVQSQSACRIHSREHRAAPLQLHLAPHAAAGEEPM